MQLFFSSFFKKMSENEDYSYYPEIETFENCYILLKRFDYLPDYYEKIYEPYW